MTNKLSQTKGQFKLLGKVKGIENENALKEGVTQKDQPYKSLSFFVETSSKNAIRVELFGMERDHVYAYSSKAKETKKISWADRLGNHNDYKVIGVGMGLEKGSDGKNVRKMMVEWDAIEYIKSNLKEGDSVFATGEIDFQQYQDQQGNWKESKRFTLRNISLTKEAVDFEASDFKEMSQFEQEIVVTGAEIDKTDKENPKLMVTAKVIKYNGDSADTSFIVDAKKYPKLANNMKKRFKFGDFIKVFGLCINSVELVESEETVKDDEDWGGDEDIKKDFSNNYIRNYIQELQITNVDSSTYEPKKYKEDDFISEDEDNFGNGGDFEIADDNFDGGEEEDTGFTDDDDLPFG